MKLNKPETITLNPLWQTLRDNPAVSLTAIQRQLKAPIANYIKLGLEEVYEPSNIVRIYQLIKIVDEAEDLIELIDNNDYKARIREIDRDYKDMLYVEGDMITTIAIIKSGIRSKVTDNTLIYAEGVSIPRKEQLDDNIIAELTRRGY